MNLKVITEPTEEPISLDDVKSFLRIDYNDDDKLLEIMITAAREHAETFTRRSIAKKTYELTLNDYASRVSLPNPPTISVESVLNDGQAIEYELVEEQGRSILTLNSEATITYQAGYKNVPKTIIQAMLILISHFYENRETVIVGTSVVKMPFSVEALLYPHKSGWF